MRRELRELLRQLAQLRMSIGARNGRAVKGLLKVLDLDQPEKAMLPETVSAPGATGKCEKVSNAP